MIRGDRVNMTVRKTADQIKKEILSYLKEGPRSIKNISEKIGSNWATINSHIEELKEENKIREIFSAKNMKVYVRLDYPVFYGLPLNKIILNDCVYLLSKIAEIWKQKKAEILNKTTMQKIAVEIIKNNPLFKLPVVRFHYGKVLPISVDPSTCLETISEYEIHPPKNAKQILIQIKQEVESDKYTNIAWKDRKTQYDDNEDMEIFRLKESLVYEIYDDKSNEKDIKNLIYKIFLEIPSNKAYSYLFKKYHELINAVEFIINSKEFESSKQQYLKEILDTFNSIWQALTTKFFFEDFQDCIGGGLYEINEFIENSKIDAYYFEIEDKINNLIGYKTSLKIKKQELDNTEKKIIGIILEGANEE